MEKLYKLVTAEKERYIFIKGPTGTGKTTSLFWLYQQLQQSEKYFPLAVPVNSLESFYEDIIAYIRAKKPKNKQLVLLVDVISPSLITIRDI